MSPSAVALILAVPGLSRSQNRQGQSMEGFVDLPWNDSWLVGSPLSRPAI